MTDPFRTPDHDASARRAHCRLATMASPTGIFLLDASGELTFANPRLLEIARVDEPALLGLGFLRCFHFDARDDLRRQIAEQLVAGGDARGDIRLCGEGDSATWVRIWTSAIRDLDGTISGLAGVIEDITGVRAAEERTRAMALKFQQRHRFESLGALAGGVAHDFNNLLAGIMGHAELAQLDLPPGSEAAQALEDLQLAAERATEFTGELRAYAGRGTTGTHAVRLGAVIHETYALLRPALSPRARIALDLDPALPAVRGDTARLRQAILILLTNASDALSSGEGEIVVRTSVSVIDDAWISTLAVDGGVTPGPHISVEVSDTGCGMDGETLLRIFDPFFTTKARGRGFGLAALVGTVRAHGGGIRVTSTPGCGTTFHLVLPPDPSLPAPRATSDAHSSRATNSGTILVVDDEVCMRDVTRRLLARAGFDVLEAADGPSAIRTFEAAHGRIQCVLLDLSMPGLDGVETYERLRSVDPLVRVVVTSGHCESQVVPRFPESGLAGFLQKPYDLSTLLRVTHAAIAR